MEDSVNSVVKILL